MSYFDNQYGGEDDDNKFYGDKEPDENEEDKEEKEDEEEDEEDEELEGGDVDDEGEDEGEEEELEDDDEEDDLEEDDDEDDDEEEKEDNQTGGAGSDDESESVEKKEQYLQKFSQSVNENYILDFHPESISQNYDEIVSMSKVVRNAQGIIIDLLHRTIPFLTKYEKARILGQRAKQINSGAYPFVKVPENVIDGYIIAEMELKQKRIPFIIRRPLPNGGSEYWKVQDLEDISF